MKRLITWLRGIGFPTREPRITSTELNAVSETTVFISAKSEDHKYAREVYSYLETQGFSCFFSDESLFKMQQAAYKAAIDKALEDTRHMVVVTSSRKNAESKWVMYEWNTYATEVLSDRKVGNLVTMLCGNARAADLPIGLRQSHALRMDEELHRLPSFLGGPPTTKSDLQNGFRGVLNRSLVDIIQLECLSQNSVLLRINNGSAEGKMWIQDGELIDAETLGLTSEEAFRRILGWKGGTFETLPMDPARQRTIFKSYNALLLETAQALDDSQA